MTGQLVAVLMAMTLAILKTVLFVARVRWIEVALGVYFLQSALSMVEYSKFGKLKLRESLLDLIRGAATKLFWMWGAGEDLLLNGAARRLTTGGFILKSSSGQRGVGFV